MSDSESEEDLGKPSKTPLVPVNMPLVRTSTYEKIRTSNIEEREDEEREILKQHRQMRIDMGLLPAFEESNRSPDSDPDYEPPPREDSTSSEENAGQSHTSQTNLGKENLGYPPAPFFFITEEGFLTKSFALARKEENVFDNEPGVTILSNLHKWNSYCQEPKIELIIESALANDEVVKVAKAPLMNAVLILKPQSLSNMKALDLPLDLTDKSFKHYFYEEKAYENDLERDKDEDQPKEPEKVKRFTFKKILKTTSTERNNIDEIIDSNSNKGDGVDETNGDEIIDPYKSEVEKRNRYKRVSLENLKKTTDEFIETKVPANTKKATKTALNLYRQVLKEVYSSEIKEAPENFDLDKITPERNAELMEVFFRVALKEDGSLYNGSALNTYWNSLARYFRENCEYNIKTHPAFFKVEKTKEARSIEAAQAGETPGKHRAKAIDRSILAEVAKQGKFDMKNPKGLITLAVIQLNGGWGCRSAAEMHMILNKDVTEGPLREDGLSSFLELSERITKTRTGRSGQQSGSRDYQPRVTPNDQDIESCPVRSFKLMQLKKPPHILGPEFPVFYNIKTKIDDPDNTPIWFLLKGWE